MKRVKVAYGVLLPCHRVGPHFHSPGDSMSNDSWLPIRYLNSNGSLYLEFMFGMQISVSSQETEISRMFSLITNKTNDLLWLSKVFYDSLYLVCFAWC